MFFLAWGRENAVVVSCVNGQFVFVLCGSVWLTLDVFFFSRGCSSCYKFAARKRRLSGRGGKKLEAATARAGSEAYVGAMPPSPTAHAGGGGGGGSFFSAFYGKLFRRNTKLTAVHENFVSEVCPFIGWDGLSSCGREGVLSFDHIV